MLSNDLWETLQLNPDDVGQRASFFAAYASARPAEPDIRDLIALSEMADQGEEELTAFGRPPGAEDAADYELARDVQRRRPPWVEAGERGDAWREAAMAALLLDVRLGLKHLQRAAQAYDHANRPYGLFLAQLASGSIEGAAEQAAVLLAGRFEHTMAERRRTPMLNPSQQIHLMLTVASSAEVVSEYRSLFADLAELPAARSAASFGSAGAALAEWWSFAIALLRFGEQLAQEREWLRRRFARLAAPHGQQLERAQLDSTHWRGLHSSVDLVDLDVAGALCLANRRLAVHGDPFSAGDFDDIPPLARISVYVGLEMSRPEDEEPPSREERRPLRIS